MSYAQRIIETTAPATPVVAAAPWKAKIIKAFSTVRRPKVEGETDTSLTLIVQEFDLGPATAKLMVTEGLSMKVSHDSGTLVKIEIKQLEAL